MKFLALSLVFLSLSAFAEQKIVCVSWMNLKVEIRETVVDEYATAHISYKQGNWGYEADVFEGNFNYLTMIYDPLKLKSTSRSENYPLNRISGAIDLDQEQATVDCDIR